LAVVVADKDTECVVDDGAVSVGHDVCHIFLSRFL
jgi:hypothetical protein